MKPFHILALAGAVLGAALPALPAQAAPVPADPVQRCRDLIPMIAKATPEAPTAGTVTPVGEASCRYTELKLVMDQYRGWVIGTLTIDRIDFERFYTDRPPLTLAVRAEDIRFEAPALPPPRAYQMKLLHKPIEVTFDYDYDEPAGLLTLRDFTFRGDYIGHLSVSAAMRGLDMDRIDPRNPLRDGALAELSLQSLTVDFDNQGMFEGYALLPALYALPNGETDPEGAVAAAKAQAMAGLAVLTAAGVPQESVDAIGRFIQAMPQPRGPFRLSIAPQPPLALAELETARPDDPAKLMALVKRLNLTASY
ncbi:hypothetical protein [Inquilinus sp. Marseille-Q2685]|uniref:hypothetical protein n=1 Tax=Inquilinus sp. Marseille-Q2685 TaxID=2866581 RepID=UPI001CE48878|nr:hypothetical protein [Inquilinus sp. Marseille-Q2685]